MVIKNVTHFVFPVGTPFRSVELYYQALARSESGFFPISDNFMLHPGIHIDDNVLSALHAEEGLLKCVAQGEVIAYRVNDVYPKITYAPPNKIQKRYAYFSNGFTLVRHRLAMPSSVKKSAQETTLAGFDDDAPAITLYSLYMHQLDWFGYEHKENPLYPNYWDNTEGAIKATNTFTGTVIRAKGKGSPGIGLLLKDSQIRLGENVGHEWYRLMSLESGCVITEKGPQYEWSSFFGYVHRSNLDITPASKVDADKIYTIKGIHNSVFGSPATTKTGTFLFADSESSQPIGCIFTGTKLKLGERKGEYVNVLDSNDALPPQSPVWVNITDLAMIPKPKAFNTVVILETPVPIEAGEMIGYVGHYHNVKQTSEEREFIFSNQPSARDLDTVLKRLSHVELFTCEDLPSFIAETRKLTTEAASPWMWQDLWMLEENTSPAEIYHKLKENQDKKSAILEPTPLIKAIHDILKQTSLYEAGDGKIQPVFNTIWLKTALREHKTATQLSNLALQCESEWYADEGVSKWNAIDDVLKIEMQKTRNKFEQELRDKKIIEPKIKRALSVFDDMHQTYHYEWQTEKKERIKPLLWWKEVAEAQRKQPKTNVSNLSKNARAWFLHPVKIVDLFFHAERIKTLSYMGLRFLKEWEGVKLAPYNDQTGKPIKKFMRGATIGVGHLILSEEEFELYKNGISNAACDHLLQNDLENKDYIKVICDSIKVDINQNQFDALVALVFNIGIFGFQNSSVVKIINSRQHSDSYKRLEDAWLAWNKSQEKFNQGIYNRRKSEYYLFRHGNYTRFNSSKNEYIEI